LEKGRLIGAEKAWVRSCHGATGPRNVPAAGKAVNDIRQTAFIAAAAGAPGAPGQHLGTCLGGPNFARVRAGIPIKRRFSSYIKNGLRTLR
jgi:hypothetical protein